LATPRLTWAFLTRAGSERDLIEEIGESHLPESIAEGVVVSAGRPRQPDAALRELTFARQALDLDGPPADLRAEILADRLVRAMGRRFHRSAPTWTLQVVAPDSANPRDQRRRAISEVETALKETLLSKLSQTLRDRYTESGDAAWLTQVWALDPERAVVGVTSVHEALSKTAGGKIHLRRAEDAPSRSGLKLEEAIHWIGIGPERGDQCVDLGASPGGWSQVAVGRGAAVLAIDPAPVKIDLPPRRFAYIKKSAFEYAPEETLDWLLCDMAWRPLEVAQLIAKWGRRAWARQAIVNFKLPMRKKVEILSKILDVLAAAGWRGIRSRQLYHDRDEVTVFAWLDPNIVRQGARAPFELRSRKNETGRARRKQQAGRKNGRPGVRRQKQRRRG
jgi:23S rRNA (cytidine2498-2'-O)-methyltransferase